MNESNCNCCACQYSTPPWWVTMGFIPPYGYQGPSGGATPIRGSGTTSVPGPTGGGTQTQQTGGGGNPLGNILGDVVGGLGGLLGGLL